MAEDNKKYLNEESGLARLRGNKKLYVRMLGMFLNSAEFGKFEEAISASDMPGAGDLAHAIKGIAGNLSLDLLAEYSTSLMTQLRGGTYDEATLAAYRDAYTKTKTLVEEYVAASA